MSDLQTTQTQVDFKLAPVENLQEEQIKQTQIYLKNMENNSEGVESTAEPILEVSQEAVAETQEPVEVAADQETVSTVITESQGNVDQVSSSQETASQESVSQDSLSQESVSQEFVNKESVSQESVSQESVVQDFASQESTSQESSDASHQVITTVETVETTVIHEITDPEESNNSQQLEISQESTEENTETSQVDVSNNSSQSEQVEITGSSETNAILTGQETTDEYADLVQATEAAILETSQEENIQEDQVNLKENQGETNQNSVTQETSENQIIETTETAEISDTTTTISAITNQNLSQDTNSLAWLFIVLASVGVALIVALVYFGIKYKWWNKIRKTSFSYPVSHQLRRGSNKADQTDLVGHEMLNQQQQV